MPEAAPTPLTPDWTQGVRARARAFFDAHPAAPLVASHDDADGLSSAALLARALGRAGRAPEIRLVGRGENAWDDRFAAEMAARAPAALVVADLGLAGRAPGPGAPTLVVDHHVPTGIPPGACVISGYGLEPTPSTSLLTFWAAEGLLGEAEDLLWLAAIGLIGDYGERAPFEELARAKTRHTAKRLREAATLVNAPRRAAKGDAAPALALLLKADDPADLLSGRHPEAAACQAAREEVQAALAEARRAAPRFGAKGSPGEGVAIVRVHSPCQVHPLVAQAWVGRLKGRPVFAANFGFQPGMVHFSGRVGKGGDLVALLARHRPPGADSARYGNGHRRAAGGALPPEAWDAFVESLGFGPEMRAGAPPITAS